MQKLIISGSAKLREKDLKRKSHFEDNNFEVIDYVQKIDANDITPEYAKVHKYFHINIPKSDIFFLMNEDKNGIEGYIGMACFAELSFAVLQNMMYDKNIEIYIMKMPSKEVGCYEEIQMRLKLGWIKVYKK